MTQDAPNHPLTIGLSETDIARLARGHSFVVEPDESAVRGIRLEPEMAPDAAETAHQAGRLFHTLGDVIADEQANDDD